jgi:hypothetical protein
MLQQRDHSKALTTLTIHELAVLGFVMHSRHVKGAAFTSLLSFNKLREAPPLKLVAGLQKLTEMSFTKCATH